MKVPSKVRVSEICIRMRQLMYWSILLPFAAGAAMVAGGKTDFCSEAALRVSE
jgi:hypothetical protein